MRVLFIAGYEHPVYHRKIELLADAPEVELLHITVDGYGKDAGVYPSANGAKNYTVKTFAPYWLGHHGDPHRSLLRTLDFCMRRFKPHVVHAESDLESIGTVQVTLARQIFAPRTALVHYSWQNILRKRSVFVRGITQLSLRATSHLICASNEATTVAHRQGYSRDSSVMPLVGLDTRYFCPKPATALAPRLNLSGMVIGYVGRIVRDKGLDTLLQATANVSAPVTLLIVGDGDERSNLQMLANSLQIAERCRFVGAVPYDSVSDYLNAMDVLVLPSRTTAHWKEQFGRVLVEAMGCRVAVVGSDSGAIPEVIGNADQIFHEGDADALASILNRLAADATLLDDWRERGYRRALANFTVERLAERVLTIWHALDLKSR